MPTGKVGTSGSATPYPEARRALASSLCRRESVIGGRFYLYALAAAGQAGVEKALQNLRTEIERDMGCRSVNQLSRDNLRLR